MQYSDVWPSPGEAGSKALTMNQKSDWTVVRVSYLLGIDCTGRNPCNPHDETGFNVHPESYPLGG